MEMFWRLSLGACVCVWGGGWGRGVVGGTQGSFSESKFSSCTSRGPTSLNIHHSGRPQAAFLEVAEESGKPTSQTRWDSSELIRGRVFMYCERLCAATTRDRLIDHVSSAYLSRQDARIRTKVWPEASSFCMDTEGAAAKYISVVALFFTYFYHIASGCRFVCPWSCFSRIWKSGSLSRAEKQHDAISDRSFLVLCIML